MKREQGPQMEFQPHPKIPGSFVTDSGNEIRIVNGEPFVVVHESQSHIARYTHTLNPTYKARDARPSIVSKSHKHGAMKIIVAAALGLTSAAVGYEATAIDPDARFVNFHDPSQAFKDPIDDIQRISSVVDHVRSLMRL